MNWIRLDVDWGAPMLTLVVPMRSSAALRFREMINTEKAETPEAIARVATQLLEWERPELAGLVLIGIFAEPLRQTWNFCILHPSLKRVPHGERPCERLDRCAGCKKGLPVSNTMLRLVDGHAQEFCSEGCGREPVPLTWGCYACKKRFEVEYISKHIVPHPDNPNGTAKVFACSDECHEKLLDMAWATVEKRSKLAPAHDPKTLPNNVNCIDAGDSTMMDDGSVAKGLDTPQTWRDREPLL